MKKSVRTKSNDPAKILRMISRDEELERNNGKWVAMNRAYKNHKKYDRKRDKKVNLDLDSFLFHYQKENKKKTTYLKQSSFLTKIIL